MEGSITSVEYEVYCGVRRGLIILFQSHKKKLLTHKVNELKKRAYEPTE